MNIDERLEALTHAVELLASFQRDNEAKFERLESLSLQLSEATIRLIEVAENHEARIQKLER